MATKLTKVIANFSTQITTNISVGGLIATLASNLDKQGNALPTGKYCFTLNQGKSNEQHFLCTLTGTAITAVQGVDHSGDLSAGFLKDARINDPIKLTDFVNLKTIVDILNGDDTLDGGKPLKYDGAPALTDPRQIPDKAYTDAALADKAGVSANNSFTGNNTFSGANTFTQPVSVPNPVGSSDAVNLQTVLGIAMGSVTVFTGFQTSNVRYDSLGRVESVYDTIAQKTFFIRYRTDNPQVPYMISTAENFWLLTYSVDGTLLATNKY